MLKELSKSKLQHFQQLFQVTMKLFQTLRDISHKHFLELNVHSQHIPLSWENVLIIISHIMLLLPTLAYLLFEAKTNIDRGYSFFICACSVSCIAVYLIYFNIKYFMAQSIQQFDKFIENSE